MSTCCCCWALVGQSNAGILETVGGQFYDVLPPGCTCFNPCSSKFAGVQTLRPQMITCDINAMTKDRATVYIKVGIVFRAIPSVVHRAYYSMSATGDQIRSLVIATLRGFIPEKTLDELFLERSHIATMIQQTVGPTLQNYGFEIIDVLLEDVDVRGPVRDSMNQQVFQKYNRVAQQCLGEIEKIKQITAAEGRAEADRLSGVGTANERTAIASAFQEGVSGPNGSDSAMVAMLLMIQYFDMVDALSKTGKVKPLSYFMPQKQGGGLDKDQLRERLKSTFQKSKA